MNPIFHNELNRLLDELKAAVADPSLTLPPNHWSTIMTLVMDNSPLPTYSDAEINDRTWWLAHIDNHDDRREACIRSPEPPCFPAVLPIAVAKVLALHPDYRSALGNMPAEPAFQRFYEGWSKLLLAASDYREPIQHRPPMTVASLLEVIEDTINTLAVDPDTNQIYKDI